MSILCYSITTFNQKFMSFGSEIRKFALGLGIIAGGAGGAEAAKKPHHEHKPAGVTETYDGKRVTGHERADAAMNAEFANFEAPGTPKSKVHDSQEIDKSRGKLPDVELPGPEDSLDSPIEGLTKSEKEAKAKNNAELQASLEIQATEGFNIIKEKLAKSKLSPELKKKFWNEFVTNYNNPEFKNKPDTRLFVTQTYLEELSKGEKSTEVIAGK